jgi:hypothetical protein
MLAPLGVEHIRVDPRPAAELQARSHGPLDRPGPERPAAIVSSGHTTPAVRALSQPGYPPHPRQDGPQVTVVEQVRDDAERDDRAAGRGHR